MKGHEGSRVDMEGKNAHDKGVTALPSKDEVKEKKEFGPSKVSKSLSQKPYVPPYHFHNDLLRLNLILNLLSFLIYLGNCM